jgi:hypothetical protein
MYIEAATKFHLLVFTDYLAIDKHIMQRSIIIICTDFSLTFHVFIHKTLCEIIKQDVLGTKCLILSF